MTLGMLAVWALIARVLGRALAPPSPGERTAQTAREVLAGRLARGEIDRDEYLELSGVPEGGRRGAGVRPAGDPR